MLFLLAKENISLLLNLDLYIIATYFTLLRRILFVVAGQH